MSEESLILNYYDVIVLQILCVCVYGGGGWSRGMPALPSVCKKPWLVYSVLIVVLSECTTMYTLNINNACHGDLT